MVTSIALAPGVVLWREYYGRSEQKALFEEVMRLTEAAPFYRPVMPRSGKSFSVDETNFGPLGWLSDMRGYRYGPRHPVTGKPWPSIPDSLLDLWRAVANYGSPPECCLVNLYGQDARMGAHQDRDEAALDAPVVSVSLGDEAIFRFGGPTRKGPTQSVKLVSGDVLTFGGAARRMFHGIDRLIWGSSRLLPSGGRLNLTLRRVTQPQA